MPAIGAGCSIGSVALPSTVTAGGGALLPRAWDTRCVALEDVLHGRAPGVVAVGLDEWDAWPAASDEGDGVLPDVEILEGRRHRHP